MYSDTRFNGSYFALVSSLNLYDETPSVLETTNIASFVTIDQELLKQICSFFAQFDQVINELSDDKRPTLYRVIPLRRFLIEKCLVDSADLPGLRKVKLFLGKYGVLVKERKSQTDHYLLEEQIKEKWALDPAYFMATFLQPKFKKFDDDNVPQQLAIDYVNDMIQHEMTLPVYPNNTQSSIKKTATLSNHTPLTPTNRIAKNSVLSQCIDKQPSSMARHTEVDEWIRSSLDLDDDGILQFWNRNGRVFPILADIAREILVIPESNTSVEWLFSSAKNTVDDHRTRLSVEKVDRLLFLQRNEISFEKMENRQGSKRKATDPSDTQHNNTNKNKKKEERNIFDELFAILEEEKDDRCELTVLDSR